MFGGGGKAYIGWMNHPYLMQKTTIILVILLVASLCGNIYQVVTVRSAPTLTSYLTITATPLRYPLTVTDFMGREVKIREPPRRIVSCAPSITEILAALNLTELIVGVDEFSDYPPEIVELRERGEIENIGKIMPLNIEKVQELHPDLVIIDAGLQGGAIPKLEELGLTMIALNAQTVDDVYKEIKLIGIAADREKEAEILIEAMERKINAIQYMLSTVKAKKSVAYIGWLEPIWTAGNSTFLNDLIRLAGGYNAFIDSNGWITVSPESFIERNPEIIIMGTTMLNMNPEEALEKLKNIPGIRDVEAVKNNKVYLLYGQAENIFLRPGPRVAEAVELLAKILYPEIFKTEIPQTIGNNYTEYMNPTVTQQTLTIHSLQLEAF